MKQQQLTELAGSRRTQLAGIALFILGAVWGTMYGLYLAGALPTL